MLLTLSFFSSCKKEEQDELDLLTRNGWVLISAKITSNANGDLITDIMKDDRSTCLGNAFTYQFNRNGTYTTSSSGPLCDMAAGTQPFSYSSRTLTFDGKSHTITTLTKGELIFTYTISSTQIATYKFVNKEFVDIRTTSNLVIK